MGDTEDPPDPSWAPRTELLRTQHVHPSAGAVEVMGWPGSRLVAVHRAVHDGPLTVVELVVADALRDLQAGTVMVRRWWVTVSPLSFAVDPGLLFVVASAWRQPDDGGPYIDLPALAVLVQPVPP